MAFVHGKKTAVLVDKYDLSAFFNSVDSDRSLEAVESTTFGKDAKTYVPGLGDGSISLGGLYDGAANAVDAVLQTALGATSDNVVTIVFGGAATVGNAAQLAAVIESDYKISAGVGDLVSVTADLQPDGGVYGGQLLLDLAARTATANGTAIDNTASSANGGVGNLHITTVSGTTPSITVKIQHSTDNSTWADLITFTAATAAGAEQKTVTGTVNRYIRATVTISGTTPSFTLAVAFARK